MAKEKSVPKQSRTVRVRLAIWIYFSLERSELVKELFMHAIIRIRQNLSKTLKSERCFSGD